MGKYWLFVRHSSVDRKKVPRHQGSDESNVDSHKAIPSNEFGFPTGIDSAGTAFALDLHHASIDGEIYAGDVRTFIGGEEYGGSGDFLVFAAGDEPRRSFSFRLEEFATRYLPSLRQQLESAGVELTPEPDLTEGRNRE